MEIKKEELIQSLISDELSFEHEQVLREEYLKNKEENNRLVFQRIEVEYERLEAAILGKLLYLPYSVNPQLTLLEEREYARLLNKCFVYCTNRLSTDKPDSNIVWILYVISDVLFHSSQVAQLLGEEFIKSVDKIFRLKPKDYAGEVFILMERMFVVVNSMDTPLAKEKVILFKQHPNKEIVEFIVNKHEA